MSIILAYLVTLIIQLSECYDGIDPRKISEPGAWGGYLILLFVYVLLIIMMALLADEDPNRGANPPPQLVWYPRTRPYPRPSAPPL